ncbi:unnamed protein product [Agarophyton chilense]
MPLKRGVAKQEPYKNWSQTQEVVITNPAPNFVVPKRRKVEPLIDSNPKIWQGRSTALKKESEIIAQDDEKTHKTVLDDSKHDKPWLPVTDTKPAILARIRVRPEHILPAPDIEDVSPRPPNAQEVENVLQELRKFYRGELSTASHPKTKRRKDLLDSLFATILSQATSNTNSSRAFRSLKNAYPVWEHAMNAGAEAIEKQIRCGGLARAKSRVMYNILRQLFEDRGVCSLEFLWDMSTADVKKALCSFNGVGPKTASCVLMFGMERDEFPVDTHIRRIASRLNWMKTGSSAERTYDVLNACLNGRIKYELHVLLIEHGRKTCKARSPQCDRCPLAEICPSRKELN